MMAGKGVRVSYHGGRHGYTFNVFGPRAGEFLAAGDVRRVGKYWIAHVFNLRTQGQGSRVIPQGERRRVRGKTRSDAANKAYAEVRLTEVVQ
jgi:hypothetical protein